jgi:hypothetical protein
MNTVGVVKVSPAPAACETDPVGVETDDACNLVSTPT